MISVLAKIIREHPSHDLIIVKNIARNAQGGMNHSILMLDDSGYKKAGMKRPNVVPITMELDASQISPKVLREIINTSEVIA